MKLIESSVELMQQEPGIEGMYKMIDRVAGICYNRHELHEDSKAFVDSLIKRGHLRPLEFGTVYLKINAHECNSLLGEMPYLINIYSRTLYDKGFYYITTNYRVLVEEDLLDDLQYWCEPTEYHYKRPCAHFILSRGVLDEFRTHVTLSHMAKSTRYCNETKNDMQFVKPYWFDNAPKDVKDNFKSSLIGVELDYKYLIDSDLKPQEAREILPLGLATELCSCGYIGIDNTGWNRFFEMRCDKAAHPDAKKLADKLKELINSIK